MENDLVRTLLVEDNPGDARLIQDILAGVTSTAFDVVHVDRVSKACHEIDVNRPDIILVDLSLPDGQGLDTFRQIRARAPDLPIVVMTGIDDEALAVQAVRQGAQDHLVKGQTDRHALVRALRYAIERRRAEETLRQTAAELQLRNEELSAFAYTVAHDLKSPLSNVIGFAEVLQEDPSVWPGVERQKYLGYIVRLGHKMSSIIDELLLLSEVRQADVDIQPLDMGQIVSETLLRLGDLIDRHHPELTLPETWPAARGQPAWIEEVWANYLSNAMKYGGQPPRLELGAARQPDGLVRFWVRDNGPGLSAEQRASLFRPFTRLHQARANGHGLGLSIVQRIIERHGGTVGVESEGVAGQGSTFFFSLPAVDA